MEAIKYYTPYDVARVLDISYTTVYKFIREGRLKAYRVGASWRIKPEVFRQFIRENGG